MCLVLAVLTGNGFAYSEEKNAAGAQGGAPIAAVNADPQGLVVPLLCNPTLDKHIYVRVRIGESQPLVFLLDTGAQGFYVRPWAIERLHLSEIPGAKSVDHVTNGLKSQAIRLGSPLPVRLLGLDGSVAATVLAGAVIVYDGGVDQDYVSPPPSSQLERCAGVIGFDAFDKFPILLDFAAKTMTIFSSPAELPAGFTQHATSVPLHEPESDIFSIPFLRIGESAIDGSPGGDLSASAGGQPRPPQTTGGAESAAWEQFATWLVLDTGSDSTYLPASSGISTAGKATAKARVGRVGGWFDATRVLLSAVTLPNTPPEQDVEASLIDTKSAKFNFVVGMNFLSRYRVGIDPQKHTLWLAPATNYAAVAGAVSGNSGLAVTFADGRYTVAGVGQGSSEDGANIWRGDTIKEIDGYSLAGLGAGQVSHLLAGTRNAVACVMVSHRNGEREHAAWIIHSDPFTHSSDRAIAVQTTKGRVFLLKKTNQVLVRGSDGTERWLPYIGADPPSCDAMSGCHWQRVAAGQGSYGWMLLPDNIMEPTFKGSNSYFAVLAGTFRFVVPAGSTVDNSDSGGLIRVAYSDGFHFGIDSSGHVTP